MAKSKTKKTHAPKKVHAPKQKAPKKEGMSIDEKREYYQERGQI